jgi:Spy/CpxP family protein refolding chaperone
MFKKVINVKIYKELNMKMKKVFLVFGVAAVLILSASLFAAADKPAEPLDNDQRMDQPKDKGPGGMHHPEGGPGSPGAMGEEGMMIGEIKMLAENRKAAADLKLTSDQQSKIKSLSTDFEKYAIKQMADRGLILIDLRTEMENDKIDTGKVQDIADKFSKNRGDMFKQAVLLRAQVLNLLTKDQREKFEQMKDQHREMMMKKFKKWKE